MNRFYEEIRKCSSEVREQRESGDVGELDHQVIQTIRQMVALDNIGRREGLLALAEAVTELPVEYPEVKYLKKMMNLVIEGSDPDLVEERALTKYYASGMFGYEGLQYLMLLDGVLAIQARTNPRILEEKLKAYLPADMEELYALYEGDDAIAREVKSDQILLEEFKESSYQWQIGDYGYFVAKLLYYALEEMRDHEVQRVLMEVNNGDLELMLKAAPSMVKEKILHNVSAEIGKMILCDIQVMGGVRICNIGEANSKFLCKIIKLYQEGEIVGDKFEFIKTLYEENKLEKEMVRQGFSQYHKMQQLLDEYQNPALKVVK